METPLQFDEIEEKHLTGSVTILVLVETPLQYDESFMEKLRGKCHNPCFSGNSFAIAYLTGFRKSKSRSQSLF